MILKQQLTSLEVSKRLKELGVKQESLFCWIELYKGPDDKFEPYYRLVGSHVPNEQKTFSAFTVAELGEMLKQSDHDLPWFVMDLKAFGKGGAWVWSCLEDDGVENSEAGARGEMLIYLLENGLLTPTKK